MSRIRQPKTDGRTYMYFKLENGLRVVVGSDPDKSSPAAVALAVLAGSIHEPKQIPGLAHFCEHMLLHGTVQPFGDTNFAEYVKQGGRHNAVTTVLQTCYAFEVQSEKLEGALSRFSRFFNCPIFSRAHHHQELQAIDAEHSMNVPNDFRRQWAILLLDANPQHPYHWTSGCSKSLSSCDLHEALARFHGACYTADRMSLAVLGPQPTMELAAWVRKFFASVKASSRPVKPSTLLGDELAQGGPPFLKEDFCGQLFIVPVKDLHQCKLSWLLPWQVAQWKSKPTAYASYLIGQEGPGSLLAALVSAGLSHNISVSCFDYHGCASTFELVIDMVDMSHDAIMRAGELAFAYISMLCSLDVSKEILDEHSQLQELSFHYQYDSAPYDFVQDIACNLHYYPSEEVLAADHLIYEQDMFASKTILQLLKVHSARLCLVSKSFEDMCISTEPWYGGRFLKSDSIESSWKARWINVEAGEWKSLAEKYGLQLQMRNSFIPSDFSMRRVATHPTPIELAYAEDWCRAWLKQSNGMNQPKAAASFCFYSGQMLAAKQIALAHMLCKAVQQKLRAEACHARKAGAMYKLEVVHGGILLQLLGFRDTLGKLASLVARSLFAELETSSWKSLKEQQERWLKNASKGPAYNQALNALEELLLQRPGNEELLQATSGLEERDLKQLPLKLGGSCLLEGLMTGNLHGSEALQLLNGLLDPLRQLREAPGPGPGRVPARAELLLPRGAPLTVLLMDSQNAEDANSCAVESLCNVATSTPENEAMAAVLMAIWKSMFFNELRTRQQLGYVVSSFMRARVTHISLVFLVQTERAPEVALRSIDKFLDHAFEHVLSELTEREFRGHCESLALQLEEAPRNLWEALSQDWVPIEERTFEFTGRKRQAEYLRSCTLPRIRAFVRDEVQSSPRLAVLLRSCKVAWHRVQWSGHARFVTKWEAASYKAELVPSSGNTWFGKAPVPAGNGTLPKAETGASSSPNDFDIEEDEECRVQ
ncbi:unnamed protein product [Effrenium voratum]|uniref:Insulin-degrading enzyme n=1 Tax=Effrenium voratum TaxID=2562239 RepID=A0AA36N7Z5_9DINO|nr:unnamed protein product [Effrenium voratum]CAJ1453402.1 unnamed protein product [Effrenium voratum]